MPNNNAWNRKWSGASQEHFVFKKLSNENAKTIINESPYYYDFGDGWTACIEACKAEKKEKATNLRGYDWMLTEILFYGRILAKTERKEFKKTNKYLKDELI